MGRWFVKMTALRDYTLYTFYRYCDQKAPCMSANFMDTGGADSLELFYPGTYCLGIL